MAKLGQLLVARGWINVQQLTRALQNQNAVGGRLGTCLLEMDVLGEDLLSRSLAEQLGVPAVAIEELRGIPDEVLRLIPEKLARRCRAIPFRVAGGRLDVAMQDPRNLSCQDEIAFACGRRVKVHIGHEARIFEALDKYYGEECPSRYALLLDRLNRMRYLWERDQPKMPEATREQTLPALPLSELFAGEPAMAPPPLPEPYLPPSPRPRASGIRARPPAPSPPPASMPPPPAPRPDSALPPLAEFDLRPAPRRPRAADPPAAEPPPAKPAPLPPLRPIPPGGIPPADVQPLAPEQRRAAPPAPAAAPRPAGEVGPDATRDVSSKAAPASGPPPPARETVALTAGERAALGVAPQEAAPAAVAATEQVAEPTVATKAEPVPEPAPAPAGRDGFEAVEAALAATHDREEVGRILLAFLAREYRRVALFGVTRDHVSGWMAEGDGIDHPAFARFGVGFDQPSVFLNLREGSGMHLGPLPPMAAHRALALLWGGGLPRDSVVLPVRLQQRLVAVVYADGGSHGLGGLDLERMRRLTAAAAAAFERCIRARRGGGT